MLKTNGRSVEQLPLNPQITPEPLRVSAIDDIAEHRMAHMRHVDPNLMRPSRLQLHLKESIWKR